MSLSAAEFYRAGMSLPPDVLKDVALRLLGSVDSDDAFDGAADSWLQIGAAASYDALEPDPYRAIPAGDVRAESRQQLRQLGEWIAETCWPISLNGWWLRYIDHIDGILVLPLAGRACDDDRAGVRTITFKKRTLVAYEVDQSSGELQLVVGWANGGLLRGDTPV